MTNPHYFLSCCMVVRNEEPYLEEYFEYMLLQGIEHFYCYENISSDGTFSILKRYESLGLVTLRQFSQNPIQFEAYNDALERYREESEWIIFTDTDEFLIDFTGNGIANHLKYFNSDIAALAIHWYLFGSSGFEFKGPKLVIERFTQRQKEVNQHVKSIVRPYLVEKVGKDPHSFVAKKYTIVVDENGDALPKDYGRCIGSANKFAIFHYHTKSKEEYFKRKIENPDPGTGRAYTGERIEEMFIAHDRNEVRDFRARNFAPAVKANIEMRRKESLN